MNTAFLKAFVLFNSFTTNNPVYVNFEYPHIVLMWELRCIFKMPKEYDLHIFSVKQNIWIHKAAANWLLGVPS